MNYPISQIERWDFYMIMPKCKYVREISISPNFAIRHVVGNNSESCKMRWNAICNRQ
jgi:hypothetical protein